MPDNTEHILAEYRAADTAWRDLLWQAHPDLCVRFGLIDASIERAHPPWSWEDERTGLEALINQLQPDEAMEIIRQLLKTPEHKLALTLAGMIAGYTRE